MTSRVRMSEEVREWLAAVLAEDPAVGRVVGEAVTVLFAGGAELVTPVQEVLRTRDPVTALGHAYQRLLEGLQVVRGDVADVATMRKRQELEGADDEEGRRRVRELRAKEEKVTLLSQRLQHEVDRFRSRSETIKAGYMAASAKQEIQAVLADEADDPDLGTDGAEDLAGVRASADELLAEVAELERLLGSPLNRMRELRLDAADLRLLFSVESNDCVTLLVVGMSQADWWEWYDEALSLAQDELVLDDEDFEGYDEAAFLARYFPGDEDEVRAAARKLVERSSAYRLAELRGRVGLSVEQVAERMRIGAVQVRAIEQAGVGVRLSDLAGYIEALGGRLDVTARVGTESITFR